MSPPPWLALLNDVVTCLDRQCRLFYADRLVALVLFGSVARGTMRPDSDIDLLIVADPLPRGRIPRVQEFKPVDQVVIQEIRKHAAAGLHTRLSPIFKTPAEIEAGSPLLLDMTEDARILFDRNDYMKGQLADLRRRLKKLGSRRIWVGDMWYWDLKPDMKPGEIFAI